LSLPQNLNQFETLVNIVARLRAPDGCPWDRKQTHASLCSMLRLPPKPVILSLVMSSGG